MNSNQKQTFCLRVRQYSKTNDVIEYEKKIVKVRKRKCDVFGRIKSQFFLQITGR